MLGLIKKPFIALLIFGGSLASTVNVSDYTKCKSLINNPCMARLALVNLNPGEYNQRLCYYQFIVNSDRCNIIYDTLDDASRQIRVPNKIEDVNLKVFNVITQINESKTMPKHMRM